MNCPKCEVGLLRELIEEPNTTIEVDKCPSCGGIWFDKGELQRIDKITEPVLVEFRRIPKEKEQLKALYCPSCEDKTLMEKADHPKDEKVIIDYCPSCQGIWLDKNELEAVQKEGFLSSFIKMWAWLLQ